MEDEVVIRFCCEQVERLVVVGDEVWDTRQAKRESVVNHAFGG
jgi:hypothetical protein